RTVEGERATLVRLVVVVEVRADDDIGPAVAVHVAGRRDGDPELRIDLAALDRPRGRGAETRRGSEVREGRALARLAARKADGAGDHVGEPVAVHVARGRHRGAELRDGLVALGRPPGDPLEARCRAAIEEEASLPRLAV